jgi:copper chaperone CopZ
MRSAAIKIQGMSCGHCVGRVTAALKQVPGVDVLRVGVGSAELRLDPARASLSAVVDAVTVAGYPAAAEDQGVALPVGAAEKRPAGCCGSK